MKDNFLEVGQLALKITKILPQRPDNPGIPIMALQLATANYIEYIRKAIKDPKESELFENLVRQTDIGTKRLIEEAANK